MVKPINYFVLMKQTGVRCRLIGDRLPWFVFTELASQICLRYSCGMTMFTDNVQMHSVTFLINYLVFTAVLGQVLLQKRIRTIRERDNVRGIMCNAG